MVKCCQILAATLLVALQLACGGPTPVAPAESPPTGPLGVVLRIEVVPGPAGNTQLTLTLENHGSQDVYLPICGPWAIYRVQDLERPVWSLACEIDYLGHRVPPGDTWRDRLAVKLEPGTYRAHTQVYGDCTLGPPREYSPREIDYGAFDACAVQQEAVSPSFEAQ